MDDYYTDHPDFNFDDEDDDEDDIDDTTEDEVPEITAFQLILGPDGKVRKIPLDGEMINSPMDPSTVKKFMDNLKKLHFPGAPMDGPTKWFHRYAILDMAFLIQMVDYTGVKAGGIDCIYFECFQDYSQKTKYTLLDAYEFLQTSQFIQFLLAYKYDCPVWDSRAIHMNMEVNDNQQRIFIIVHPDGYPKWVDEVNPHDCISESSERIITKRGLTVMQHVATSQYYYEPLMLYDLTYTIPSDNSLLFSEISVYYLYKIFIEPYIDEAIKRFFPPSLAYNDYAYRDKTSVHVSFGNIKNEKIFEIQMYISPAWILTDVVATGFHFYDYHGDSIHHISDLAVKEIPNSAPPALVTVLSRFMSTPATQRVVLSTMSAGACSDFGMETTVLRSATAFFSNRRVVFNRDKLSLRLDEAISKPNLTFIDQIQVNAVESKADEVLSYWVPINDTCIIDLNPYETSTEPLKLYGMLNIDLKKLEATTYSALMKSLSEEIIKVFGRHPEFLKYLNAEENKVLVTDVYRDERILRVMFGEILPRVYANSPAYTQVKILSDEKPDNKKKSWKLW